MTKGAVVSNDPPGINAVDEAQTRPDRRAQRRTQRQAQSRQNRIDILDAAEKVFGRAAYTTGPYGRLRMRPDSRRPPSTSSSRTNNISCLRL